MTVHELLTLAELLCREVASEAYSHRKRDLIFEIIADLVKRADESLTVHDAIMDTHRINAEAPIANAPDDILFNKKRGGC